MCQARGQRRSLAASSRQSAAILQQTVIPSVSILYRSSMVWHDDPDSSRPLLVLTTILIIWSTLFAGIRLWARWTQQRSVLDITFVASYVCAKMKHFHRFTRALTMMSLRP